MTYFPVIILRFKSCGYSNITLKSKSSSRIVFSVNCVHDTLKNFTNCNETWMVLDKTSTYQMNVIDF